jgi:hypothetical protein
MTTRRLFLFRGGLGLLGAAGASLAGPGDAPDPEAKLPDGSASRDMINDQTDKAIERGLAFLSSRQHGDGSFGTNGYSGNVAVTSLAGLAFMAGGHQPNRGRYGREVTRALRFILTQENRDGGHPGFLHNPNASPHGPMYGHGFAALFLAEASGMIHDKELREEVHKKLKAAVDLILKSQNREGGWRYMPNSADADLSVTICQIMALRAARNAGVAVERSKVDACVKYVMGCRNADGSFRYMKNVGFGGGGLQGFARTAAGVCALNSAGYYRNTDTAAIKNDEERRRAEQAVEGIRGGLRFLLRAKPNGGFHRPDMHYFYGHYYAVQAMWTAGGDFWKEWYPAIRDELLGLQNADGSWIDQICSHYGTAMACIILQVPNNYLPILQK